VNIEKIRAFCLALPGTTEDLQWGSDLLFRIGRKIYVSACLDPSAPVRLSLKCTPEEFAELTEREGIAPAAYVARYHWISLERWDALEPREIERLVRKSYELVLAGLPRKIAAQLAKAKPPRRMRIR
jgi:predicted DNA-binding protein (MmcQ/YjbR family)